MSSRGARRGSIRRACRLRGADFAHSLGNEHQQRLRPHRSDHRDGSPHRRRLSHGRFILGIGSSHKVQVEGEHGVPYVKPLTRVRETVELIRRLARDGGPFLWGDDPRREFRPVVHAQAPRVPNLCLGRIPKDGRPLRRDRRRHYPDPQHSRHGRWDQKPLGRGGAAGRPTTARGL